MSNKQTSFKAAMADGSKQREALTADEMDKVVAGTASGNAGVGSVSIWSWMKDKMLGVQPSFFD